MAPCYFHYCHLLRVVRQSRKTRRTEQMTSCYCQVAGLWVGESSSWLQWELSLREAFRVWSLNTTWYIEYRQKIFFFLMHSSLLIGLPLERILLNTSAQPCSLSKVLLASCHNCNVPSGVIRFTPEVAPLQWKRMEMCVQIQRHMCVYKYVCI